MGNCDANFSYWINQLMIGFTLGQNWHEFISYKIKGILDSIQSSWLLFRPLITVSLWGNVIDLTCYLILNTLMTYSLITKLQLTPLGNNRRLKLVVRLFMLNVVKMLINFYIVKQLIVWRIFWVVWKRANRLLKGVRRKSCGWHKHV